MTPHEAEIPRIIREPISLAELADMAAGQFGELVKVVVDIGRGIMTAGGALHADEEAILIEDGSRQEDLWGINIFPSKSGEDFIEFDSMINIRPVVGNRTRGVEDPEMQRNIQEIVSRLITR